MDELQQLLERIQAAKASGTDAATLDRAIQAATADRFSTVAALEVAVFMPPVAAQDASAAAFQESPSVIAARQASGIDAALLREAERGNSPVSDFGRLAAQGLTFGFGDEIAGLAAGLVPGGQTREEATEASRQRLADLRLLNPGASFAAEVAGSIPTAGLGLLGLTRAPASLGGRFLAGTAAGGAEGFLFGFGEAEGSVGERLPEAAVGGLLGTAIGAAGGAVGAVQAGRAARRARPNVGGRLADVAREAGDLTGKPSTVVKRSRARQAVISERRFKPLEELGPIESPRLRKALDKDLVGEVVGDLFPEIAEGTPPTFRQLQSIRAKLQGVQDKAARSGDSFELNRAVTARKQLTEAIGGSVEGFDAAQKAWRREMDALRALEDGRKLWTKPADDVQTAFAKLTDIRSRESFREGLAVKMFASLDDGAAGKRQLERLLEGKETRKKLRILMGSEDALETFTEAVRLETDLRNRAILYDQVIRGVRRAGLALGAGAAGGSVVRGLLN